MKKNIFSAILFMVSFVAAYALLCLLLPGGAKMALEATAVDHILVRIRHMALLKVTVSLAAAMTVTVVAGRKQR